MVWYVRPTKIRPVKLRPMLDGRWWLATIFNYIGRLPKSAVFAVAAVPQQTGLNAVAAATFGPGGPGFVLLQLLLLAVVSYMVAWLASATGHGQFASMAKLTALLGGFAIVCGAIWGALEKIWSIVG